MDNRQLVEQVMALFQQEIGLYEKVMVRTIDELSILQSGGGVDEIQPSLQEKGRLLDQCPELVARREILLLRWREALPHIPAVDVAAVRGLQEQVLGVTKQALDTIDELGVMLSQRVTENKSEAGRFARQKQAAQAYGQAKPFDPRFMDQKR